MSAPDFGWLFRLLRDALLVCIAILLTFWGLLNLLA
jgi:hypothetical protein